MADANDPPPNRRVALAAAGGGFGGAVLGVIAASAMMGDGSNGQASVSPQETAPIAVAEATSDE